MRSLPRKVPKDARVKFTEVAVAADSGGGFAHTLPELTPGLTYYARVAAHNRLGCAYGRCAAPAAPLGP